MQEVATLRFRDDDEPSEVLAIVQATEREVALCLSRLDDSDTEVFMDPATCEQLIAALQRALEIAKQPVEAV